MAGSSARVKTCGAVSGATQLLSPCLRSWRRCRPWKKRCCLDQASWTCNLQQHARKRSNPEEQQEAKRPRTGQQQTDHGQGQEQRQQGSKHAALVEELTLQLAKLVLRHEDQLARVQQDTLSVFLLSSGRQYKWKQPTQQGSTRP